MSKAITISGMPAEKFKKELIEVSKHNGLVFEKEKYDFDEDVTVLEFSQDPEFIAAGPKIHIGGSTCVSCEG